MRHVDDAMWILASDSGPEAEVLVPPDMEPPLQKAVELLYSDLRLATGHEFPVVTEAGGSRTRRIAVGIPHPHAPMELVRDDGYTIWTVDDTIHLAGNSLYGHVNAIAGFIDKVLGVKHYMPGPLFTHGPKEDLRSIVALRQVSNPTFPTRAYGLANPLAKEWCILNRIFNKQDPRPFIASSHHNIGFIFMREDLLRDHPEYFALRGGKRDVPVPAGGGKYDHLLLAFIAQPCFSHPAVIEEATKAARDFFDATPAQHTFSLGVNDTEKYCECETCAAINAIGADQAPRLISNRRRYMVDQGHAAGRNSNVYFHFVNEVAKRLKESHPGKFLGCLAYESVEEPPTNIEQLEDNICICLTQDSSQYFDAAYRQRDLEIFDTWLAKCSHVMKYDYYGLMWYFPRYYPQTVEGDVKNQARLGLVGMYSEVHPIWPFTGPMLYMGARLLWDATLDGDKIREEFYKDLYGAAAEDVKAFYNLYEELWNRPRTGQWFQGLLFPPQLDQYAHDQVVKAHGLLSSAASKLPAGIERTRVEHLIQYHQHTLSISAAEHLSIRASEAEDNTEAFELAGASLAALQSLDPIRQAVLTDLAAESSLWTGFRYDAMYHYLVHRVRSRLGETLRPKFASLSEAEANSFSKLIEDESMVEELWLHRLEAQGNVSTRAIDYDGSWSVERGEAKPGVEPMSVVMEPAQLQLKGAGTVSLTRTDSVEGDGIYGAVLPADTEGICILTELDFSVAWMNAQGHEIRKASVRFGEFKGHIDLRLAGRVPANCSQVRFDIRLTAFMPDEGFTLGNVKWMTAKR